MRSTRLLRLLVLLQTRRHLTAELCARELEVSPRTIYRDLEALATNGVPVVTERGPGGGIGLQPGWRTQVPGLAADEVIALAALSAPLALAGLGLSSALESALDKVSAGLPAFQKSAARRAQERLHLDPSGWFGTGDPVQLLPLLRDACFENRCLSLDYRDAEGRVTLREVEPLGLVLKGAHWYLVARDPNQSATRDPFRVFRGSRIRAAKPTSQVFTRPPQFSLATFWKRWTKRFLEERPSYRVRLRLDPVQAALLATERPEPERQALRALAARGRSGRLEIDFERRAIALAQLCVLGPGAEVLAPRELRRTLLELGRAWVELYGAER